MSREAVVPVGRRWFQSGGGGGPVRCPCPGPPEGPHPLSPTSWERGSLLYSASQFPKFHDLKTAQLCPWGSMVQDGEAVLPDAFPPHPFSW